MTFTKRAGLVLVLGSIFVFGCATAGKPAGKAGLAAMEKKVSIGMTIADVEKALGDPAVFTNGKSTAAVKNDYTYEYISDDDHTLTVMFNKGKVVGTRIVKLPSTP